MNKEETLIKYCKDKIEFYKKAKILVSDGIHHTRIDISQYILEEIEDILQKLEEGVK